MTLLDTAPGHASSRPTRSPRGLIRAGSTRRGSVGARLAGASRLALLALACLALACGDGGGTFTDCVATPDCSGGRQCFALSSGAGVCLSTCPAEQALCAMGEACVPTGVADEDWVCLPGGNVALGGVCARSVDCDLGGVCVTEGSFNLCRRACDPRAATCSAGTTCMPWTAERGYCAPIVATPDMGTATSDMGAADGG